MFVIVGKNSFINVLGLFVERSLKLKKKRSLTSLWKWEDWH